MADCRAAAGPRGDFGRPNRQRPKLDSADEDIRGDSMCGSHPPLWPAEQALLEQQNDCAWS